MTVEPSSGVHRHAIREQLGRILASPEFHATDKMRGFLRFVVEEKLAGRSHRLKGYTVAVEVFGRGEDFDAANDPIVRIQAGRLRRALERYYLVASTPSSSTSQRVDTSRDSRSRSSQSALTTQTPRPRRRGISFWPVRPSRWFRWMTWREIRSSSF